MISAKDLMIGDWVKSRGKIEQVTSVYDGFICTDSFENSHDCYFDPIPITTEILEKNGFENDFYEEESVADYHTIRLEGYSLRHNIGEADGYLVTWCNGGINVTTDVNGCVQKDISYVHELQHALRLCGISKNIEL